jgi:hypothetical protein
VSGPDGAAALIGMKPSTLSSRMKAMGIRRVIRQIRLIDAERRAEADSELA